MAKSKNRARRASMDARRLVVQEWIESTLGGESAPSYSPQEEHNGSTNDERSATDGPVTLSYLFRQDPTVHRNSNDADEDCPNATGTEANMRTEQRNPRSVIRSRERSNDKLYRLI